MGLKLRLTLLDLDKLKIFLSGNASQF